jgi:hypothetical protein
VPPASKGLARGVQRARTKGRGREDRTMSHHRSVHLLSNDTLVSLKLEASLGNLAVFPLEERAKYERARAVNNNHRFGGPETAKKSKPGLGLEPRISTYCLLHRKVTPYHWANPADCCSGPHIHTKSAKLPRPPSQRCQNERRTSRLPLGQPG